MYVLSQEFPLREKFLIKKGFNGFKGGISFVILYLLLFDWNMYPEKKKKIINKQSQVSVIFIRIKCIYIN